MHVGPFPKDYDPPPDPWSCSSRALSLSPANLTELCSPPQELPPPGVWDQDLLFPGKNLWLSDLYGVWPELGNVMKNLLYDVSPVPA